MLQVTANLMKSDLLIGMEILPEHRKPKPQEEEKGMWIRQDGEGKMTPLEKENMWLC